ncbi:hypothetical protein D3C73_907110 [compost metagenome]
MILQVFTHPRQFVYQINIQTVQQGGRPHAGALQDLWRGDRPGAQQHFPTRTGTGDILCFTLQVVNAHRPLAVEADAIGQCVGHNLQIRARTRLIQITASGAGTTTFRRYGAIHRAEAFLLVAVQILGTRVACLNASLHHRVE